jgi:hypothetical protein
MTLRMVVQATKAEEGVLALHGWLAGPEVEEFERVAAGLPLPLRIDLAQLVGADPSGVTALHAQRGRGARLANASPYISLLLKSGDEPDGGTPPPRRGPPREHGW